MKKAVIVCGARQYLVSEGDELEVNHVSESGSLSFSPLLVIDDKEVLVGAPTLEDHAVRVEVVTPELKGEKVTAIRYKAKKRVKKVRGHRQLLTKIRVTCIK